MPFIPTNASPRKNKSEKRPANKRCNSTWSNSFKGFLERDKRVTSPRAEEDGQNVDEDVDEDDDEEEEKEEEEEEEEDEENEEEEDEEDEEDEDEEDEEDDDDDGGDEVKEEVEPEDNKPPDGETEVLGKKHKETETN